MNRSSLRIPRGGALRAALAAPILGLMVACGGGGAAAPTPTAGPTAAVAVAPAASPQRPPLASPAASPSAAVSPPSSSAAATPTAGAADATAGDTYDVQSGDTLASIAQDKYGDSTQWRRIYDANKDAIGSDPDKLKLGMQLKIPPKQ